MVNYDELAQNIFNELDDSGKKSILASNDFEIEVEYEDNYNEEKYSEEDLNEIKTRILKMVFDEAPARCFIKCDDWHLLYYDYLVFGDLDDEDALADNLEAFEVPYLWLFKIDKQCYQLEEHAPLGVMFIKVPKWSAEAFEKALDNYARRMEWEHHGFINLAKSVIADLEDEDDD